MRLIYNSERNDPQFSRQIAHSRCLPGYGTNNTPEIFALPLPCRITF
jgi:hypothetical protein